MYIFSLDVHIYSYDRIFMGFFFEGLKDFLKEYKALICGGGQYYVLCTRISIQYSVFYILTGVAVYLVSPVI